MLISCSLVAKAAVVDVVDRVVLDAVEVRSFLSSGLDPSWASVTLLPGTLVLFMGARAFAVVPAAAVRRT